MKLEFSNEEAQVLINLIDIAVKSVGLQAAESGVHFVKKLQDAAKVVEEPVAVDAPEAPQEPAT
jgi:hypothetical protein